MTPTGVGTAHFFAGTIDEVAVYSSELTAAQVSSHYLASPAAKQQAPTAAFTSSCTALSCSFDGTGSSDPDGSVSGYSWDFGDGAKSTSATPTHSFAAAGDYTVTLTVTDDGGATGTVSHAVHVTAPVNKAPTAAFTSSCTALSCSFDGTGSSDPDGSVSGYSWDFGDGAKSTSATPTHSFAAAGDYTVTLTVTDDGGATGTVSHAVHVTAPVNKAPTAAFTSSCTALSCSFDGTGSSDPDGSVSGYSWDFGDGAKSTSATPTHSFAAAGDYTVTLTVTDDGGATGTVSHTVSPRPAANPSTDPFASDAFNRTLASGWGTADKGGPWSAVGSAANLSVANGSGLLKLAAASSAPGAFLNAVSTSDSDSKITYTTDKPATGNGIYLYLVGRHVSTNNEYRARIRILSNNTVALAVTKLANSATETVIGSEVTLTGVTYTPGMMLNVRYQVTGTSPTTLRLKAWPSSSTEPTAWRITTTDNTSGLQSAGSVGVTTYLSGSATNAPVMVSAASYSARPTVAPPTAAFTSSTNGLTASVDGSGSSDPNGTVSSYQWSWGDGSVTTGVTSTHTFAQSGTYRITLTATDPSGWTDVTTRNVTVP